MWENEWGQEFDSEEEAFNDVHDKMEWSDYKESMQYSISWDALFDFARNHEDFFDHFEREISRAEEEFFTNYYHSVDD